VLSDDITKFPPVEIKTSVVCTIENIPIFYKLLHIDVHADEQKLSPVNELWIKPYLVNCWHIFSITHAIQFKNDNNYLYATFESWFITCCSAENMNNTNLIINAIVINNDPIAMVPNDIIALFIASTNAPCGPSKSCSPSWN